MNSLLAVDILYMKCNAVIDTPEKAFFSIFRVDSNVIDC